VALPIVILIPPACSGASIARFESRSTLRLGGLQVPSAPSDGERVRVRGGVSPGVHLEISTNPLGVTTYDIPFVKIPLAGLDTTKCL
jgi:hypothetical protein